MPAFVHRHGPRPSAPRGVTLPELLTVIAIIAITVLIVVPTFAGRTSANSLRAGARGLAATLGEAQNRAIRDRQNIAVVLDSDIVVGSDANPIPVTRYWLARLDNTFDPATDETDIADSDSAPPFDGEWTKLEQLGEQQQLPEGIVVVAALIASEGFQGNDFTPTFRINAMRTEDVNLNGGVSDTEDVGVDSFNDGNGAIAGRAQAGFDPVDPGEDDEADDDEDPATPPGVGEDIDSVYRIIRFGPQGNADRAILWLWDFGDGRAALPETVAANAPASLRALGLPPGMTLVTPTTQRSYFTVSDQSQDIHYYTIDVNPTTGKVVIYDYARGTATVGAVNDWNLAKDGES